MSGYLDNEAIKRFINKPAAAPPAVPLQPLEVEQVIGCITQWDGSWGHWRLSAGDTANLAKAIVSRFGASRQNDQALPEEETIARALSVVDGYGARLDQVSDKRAARYREEAKYLRNALDTLSGQPSLPPPKCGHHWLPPARSGDVAVCEKCGVAASLPPVSVDLNELDELLPEPQGMYQTIPERVSLLKHQRDHADELVEMLLAELAKRPAAPIDVSVDLEKVMEHDPTCSYDAKGDHEGLTWPCDCTRDARIRSALSGRPRKEP